VKPPSLTYIKKLNHVRNLTESPILSNLHNRNNTNELSDIKNKQSMQQQAQKFIKQTQSNSAKVFQEGKTKFKENRDQMSKMSKDLREKTLQKSKDLKANIQKIIPKDIHENIYTVPNILTFTRLISAPAIGYLIIHGQVTLALALFTYSCITDFLDGYIARNWKLQSVVGSVIDPLADKMLMMICTVCLAKTAEIPFYLATLIIGRDVSLGLAAVFIRYISLPEPKTIWRYWDFSIPSAEVHPTKISKINTALQMLYLGSMMIKPVFMLYLSDQFGSETTTIFLACLQYLEYTVAITTLWSGLSYLFSKTAVKFVKQ
jgi:cardiolipin synthase